MSTVVVPSFNGIVIEWRECEMDPLFLAILREEELVGDDTVYNRTLEG